jgi:uncharacterized protein YdbL (DUF1318 family)
MASQDASSTKPYKPENAGKRCLICGKPLSPLAGDIGDTCKGHVGKLRIAANTAEVVPEGFIRMSKVCEAANKEGITTSALVNATGGDAATKPVMDPVFTVTYVGRGKWLNPDVLTKGFALLKAHQLEKAETKAKVPAVVEAGEEEIDQ